MESLQIFNYQQNQIRTVVKDGEPWFVANDVCFILGIGNANMAAARLDDDEVSQAEVIDSMGRIQNTNIVNEMGLYNLILRSDKREAKQFKRWVTHDVLPSIRKHGMYAKEELLNNPDLLIEVATKLKEERKARIEAENKAQELLPAANFGNAVKQTKGLVLVRDYVKVLANDGIRISQSDLFAWFKNHGYLYQNVHGDYIPYSEYIKQDLFRVGESPIETSRGSFIAYTTRLTGKGQDYFYRKLKEAV